MCLESKDHGTVALDGVFSVEVRLNTIHPVGSKPLIVMDWQIGEEYHRVIRVESKSKELECIKSIAPFDRAALVVSCSTLCVCRPRQQVF